MARHTSPQHPTAQRALVALAVAGAALGTGTAAAHADAGPQPPNVPWRPTSLGKIDPQAGLTALSGATGYITGPVAGLKPNPLAGTGVDPLDNGLGTQVADFKPVTSQALTTPVAEAESLRTVPVVGRLLGALGH
ncbi:hypothetical protein JK361_14615 [Streptomyces sp. 5-8]|uniref:ATP-binding protein n=1 Tax=Streptomyces musisoli TaxID=2802280 RepID=A0ABS1P168_9ACTN|nr:MULTISPECIES: hypothetical protein [Streptomyces]MBL1105802.1 hypothetical protein [Streptomyces musisoli]MBY8841690.1 hypothetical protein [Streptomyces sp. SP2-10]